MKPNDTKHKVLQRSKATNKQKTNESKKKKKNGNICQKKKKQATKTLTGSTRIYLLSTSNRLYSLQKKKS